MSNDLREALAGMLAIVDESRGVEGYHLNGDVAYWEDFLEVEAARAALAALAAPALYHASVNYTGHDYEACSICGQVHGSSACPTPAPETKEHTAGPCDASPFTSDGNTAPTRAEPNGEVEGLREQETDADHLFREIMGYVNFNGLSDREAADLAVEAIRLYIEAALAAQPREEAQGKGKQ